MNLCDFCLQGEFVFDPNEPMAPGGFGGREMGRRDSRGRGGAGAMADDGWNRPRGAGGPGGLGAMGPGMGRDGGGGFRDGPRGGEGRGGRMGDRRGSAQVGA